MPTGPFRNVVDHARRLARSHSSSNESDRQLLARFVKNRDQDAFGALVDRHGSLVLGVCRRVLGNEHDAQDAFQGTFLVLARKANRLQWRDSISNWLHGVAYRIALQVRESRARQRISVQRMLESGKFEERRDKAGVHELCVALDEELTRLPDRYQTALICCYLKGLTRDQAALECGWSLRTLDRRLQQGRELLKVRMLRRGISLSAALLITGLTTQGTQAGVNATLTNATVRAALSFATGPIAKGGISSAVVASAERMSGLTTIFRLKSALAVGLIGGIITLGTGAVALQRHPATDPIHEPHQESILADQQTPGIQTLNMNAQRGLEPLPSGALVRLGTDRLKSLGNMMNMAFSPEGGKLATWCDEYMVNNAFCVWDVHTGSLLRRVDLLGAKIDSLEWLQDGRGIALIDTGHAERGLLVWEFTAGNMIPVVAPERADGFGRFFPPPRPPADKCYAVSPDGRTLAVGRSGAGGKGGQVVLRQLKPGMGTSELFTQRQLATMPGNCGLIRFTPDGKRLVVLEEIAKAPPRVMMMNQGRIEEINKPQELFGPPAEAAQLVVVLEVASGKEICRFTAPQPTEYLANRPPVAVSNRELAIGLEDGDTKLWNLTTGASRRLATAHAGQKPGEKVGTMAIAVTPDGGTLVTGGYDGLVKVWDTGTAKLLRTQQRIFAGVESLAIARDDRTIAAGYDGFLRLWDAQSSADKCPQPGHEYSVRQAVLSSDGKTAVTSSWDNSLRWWSTSTGRELLKVELPGKAEAMALSPDGRTIVAAVDGNKVRTWNLADGKEQRSTELAGEMQRGRMLFTPDGKRLLAASDDRVQIFAWPTLALQSTIVLPKPEKQPGKTSCQFLTVSNDSRWLCTVAQRSTIREERGVRYEGVQDGVVELWDLQTAKRVRAITQGEGTVLSAHFLLNHQLLLAEQLRQTIPARDGRPAEDFSGNIVVLDPFAPHWLRSFDEIRAREVGGFRHAATTQLSPDGRTLYVGYNRGDIRAYEVATGKLRRQFSGHRSHVYSLSLTPDGKKLISGGRDGNAVVWNTSLSSIAEPLKQPADDASAERVWSSMPLEDAQAAYVALANLSAMPEQAVRILRSQIEALREPGTLEEKPAIRVRQIRALELLEAIATPSAKALLEELGKGEGLAPVTVEAKATLVRLGR